MARLDVDGLIRSALAEYPGDPLAQLKALTELVGAAEELQRQTVQLRVDLILQLREDDRSFRWIAERIGISQQAISQMMYRHARKRARDEGREL